jgi:NAD(P)-dependent dehydrogenase (short-subunit alcohol dehydrogenase family)
MNRFAGKLAVVAGGARGMGAACAGRLAAAGAEVAVLDHAAAEPVDVTSEQQVTEFFSALPRPPDVMVNAVGNANLALIED